MMHPDATLRRIDDRIGYGVVATRFIPRGTVVWCLCALDRVLTPAEVEALPPYSRRQVERYGYRTASGDHVLCWDFARYINHACDPAMLGLGTDLEIAVRDIRPGDELTCDYGACNLVEDLACRCGMAGCRGRVGAADALALGALWDRQVREILPLIATVAQPLRPFLRDPEALMEIVSGRRGMPSLRDCYFRTGTTARPGEAGIVP